LAATEEHKVVVKHQDFVRVGVLKNEVSHLPDVAEAIGVAEDFHFARRTPPSLVLRHLLLWNYKGDFVLWRNAEEGGLFTGAIDARDVD
jgi:hypothetical protein